MLLIANGCSHTAGAEMEKPYQGECYEKAWPKKLARIMNADSVNLAISGASDDRVCRTTIQYLSKVKKSTNYDPSKVFVSIAWPGLYRSEIFNIKDRETGFWDNGWMPIVSGNDESYREQCSTSSYAYYRAWVMRLNPTQETIRFYSNVLLLQNLLIANKIKFIFWNACSNVPHDQRAYFDEVYKKRFPFLTQKEYSFTNLLHNQGFKHSEFAQYGHYGEDSQEWFADFLYRYMTKEKLL